VTLEGWVDVMREQMKGPQAFVAPFYFISFIVIGTMIVLNLFIGTIVGSMTEAQQEHKASQPPPENAAVTGTSQTASTSIQTIKALEDQLEELRQKCAAWRLGLGEK
jgi:voltage-gated sodium channel